MSDEDDIPTSENTTRLDENPTWKQRQAEREKQSFSTKEEWIEWFNKDHACNTIKGKFKIMHEKPDGSIEFLDRKHFIDTYEHKRIMITSPEDGKTKFVPIAELWLKSPQRRQYNGITFNPEKEGHYDDLYNLWKGYPIKPIKGDVSIFMDYMKEVFCVSDNDFNFLDVLISQMIQRPWDKPGIAVVIRGDEGVGKSFLVEKLGYLMGDYYFKTSNPAYIFGDHNGQLKDKLMLHLEEAVWAGSKKDESLLKDLITGLTIQINEKFMPVFSVPNHLHLFITGNPEWLISASFTARRMFALHASDKYRRDTAYFGKLDYWFKHGGAEALMYHYMNRKIDIDLRLAPVTDELIFQKQKSMSGVQEWFYSIADSKEFPYGDRKGDGHVHVIKSLLLSDYNNSPAGKRHQMTDRQFGIAFLGLFPRVIDGIEQKAPNGRSENILGSDRKIEDNRGIFRNAYDIPELKIIREVLEFKIGGKCNWSTEIIPDGKDYDGGWVVLRENTDFNFDIYKSKV